MIQRSATAIIGLIFAIFFIAGCASSVSYRDQKQANSQSWQGRLTVLVDGDQVTTPVNKQTFTASFELHGDNQKGDLSFFTPLGSTAATLRWTPESATMQTPGENRRFDNVSELISSLLGTRVPVAGLFDWLNGRPTEIDGWQVDLSQFNAGKILAQRISPAPIAKIRILLDQ